MSANSAGSAIGNAGSGETAKKNVDAFKRWSIVPKRLVKSGELPDLTTKVIGHEFQLPIAAGPVGVLRTFLEGREDNVCNKAADSHIPGIFNPDGELAVARAGAEIRVPYVMSTAASTNIEEVAEANGDGGRWFQLY